MRIINPLGRFLTGTVLVTVHKDDGSKYEAEIFGADFSYKGDRFEFTPNNGDFTISIRSGYLSRPEIAVFNQTIMVAIEAILVTAHTVGQEGDRRCVH